jgi:hypothetical protein
LFLQAAGSDFGKAHDLVRAITEAMLLPQSAPSAEHIAQNVERAGWKGNEALLLAIAVHVTLTSTAKDPDAGWIVSAAARIGDEDLLLEATGVVFAFNTINRIADARRVRLEFGFLRQLRPIQGWVERRLVSLVGLVYDLSYRHHPRRSPEEMQERVAAFFDRMGASAVPDLFSWLRRSPVVLDGIVALLEANLTTSGARLERLKEAAAVAVASRAMPGSSLSMAFAHLLPAGTQPPEKALEGDLASACRRYVWQVANAAYTINDEQIRNLNALGLPDAELLDLVVTTAVFCALAIIERIGTAVVQTPMAGHQTR